MPKFPLRWCVPTLIKLGIEKEEHGDFKFDGIGSSLIEDRHSIFRRRFNLTEITTNSNKVGCLIYVKNNISDYSDGFTSIEYEDSDVIVPVPVLTRKIGIAGGYNYTNYQEHVKHRIVGTTLENFSSFSIGIYLAFFLIITSILAVIFAEKMLKLYRRRRQMRWQIILRTIGRSIKQITSEKLNKWTQFSLFMTIFSFTCLFSFAFQIQQVISDPPKIIRSYEELIREPNCTALFFESRFEESILFKNATPGSMRAKVWQKSTSVRDEKSIVFSQFNNPMKLLPVVKSMINFVFNYNVVIIGTQFALELLIKLGCSLSEENEFFVPTLAIDATEQGEELMGHLLRRDFHPIDKLISFERIMLENGLMSHWSQSVDAVSTD